MTCISSLSRHVQYKLLPAPPIWRIPCTYKFFFPPPLSFPMFFLLSYHLLLFLSRRCIIDVVIAIIVIGGGHIFQQLPTEQLLVQEPKILIGGHPMCDTRSSPYRPSGASLMLTSFLFPPSSSLFFLSDLPSSSLHRAAMSHHNCRGLYIPTIAGGAVPCLRAQTSGPPRTCYCWQGWSPRGIA